MYLSVRVRVFSLLMGNYITVFVISIVVTYPALWLCIDMIRNVRNYIKQKLCVSKFELHAIKLQGSECTVLISRTL